MGGTSVRRGNLPAELSSFVGRRRQLQQVKSSLSESRLVTLVGPGGVGKTRLALRVAADLERGVAAGAWLADLSSIDDARLVAPAVMAALGLRDASGRWPLSTLIDHLQGKELLLVLDNCEHLADACSVLTDALLRDAPQLRVLATSRQPLGVSGEQLVTVGPLGLPEPAASTDAARATQSEAVVLLAARAAAAGVDLAVTNENLADVVELCRRLDGIPLAIELAAVRLRSMGIEQLVARLHDRFHLLVGGSASAPARQRTLEATIAWSHDLLSNQQQSVLRRLAVFPGSFPLAAAERVAVAGELPAPDVVDALAVLVDRSFVTIERGIGIARYRLHETMREFALQRLREADEEASARQAHLSFVAELCRRARSDGRQVDDDATLAALRALDAEVENIRGALRYCLTDPERVAIGLAMAIGLGRHWTNRALSEGVHWLDALLEAPARDDQERGRALFVRSYLAVAQGEHVAGLEAVAEAARMARAGSDDVLLVRILAMQAALHVMGDDVPAARLASAEAQHLAELLDDDVARIAAAQSEALLASLEGDFECMREVGAAAVERCRRVHEVYMLSTHLTSVGVAAMMLGEHEDAEAALIDALHATLVLDDRPGLVLRLHALTANAAAAGQAERAAQLLGATERMQSEGGYLLSPFTHPLVARATALASAELGVAWFTRAVNEGAGLDHDGAIALALRCAAAPARAAAIEVRDPLSKRERDVAELVAQGLSNKQMASRLFISERTVESHLYNLRNKLGISSRSEIGSWLRSSEA